MDPHCPLCGTLAGNSEEKWCNLVRAIYIEGHSWAEPKLSGRGWVSDGQGTCAYVVPKNSIPSSNNDASLVTRIADTSPWFHEGPPPPGTDPNEPPIEDSTWGYVFHESCWTLLQSAHGPSPINISHLMQISRSIPSRDDIQLWGHDYGGLYFIKHPLDGSAVDAMNTYYQTISERLSSDADLDDEEEEEAYEEFINCPPWGPRYTNGDTYEDDTVTAWGTFLMDAVVSADPSNIDWVQEQINTSTVERKIENVNHAEICHFPGPQTDDFACLPYDIREGLLHYLDMNDVFSARISSRSLANTILSQSFWKSRFYLGKEFGYIFEAWEIHDTKRYYRDWQMLFRKLKKGPGKDSRTGRDAALQLSNRLRIWTSFLPLINLLHDLEQAGGLPAGIPSATLWEPNLAKDDLVWSFLGKPPGKELKGTLRRGTQTLFVRKENLPDCNTVSVQVCVIEWFKQPFVTGLRFHFDNSTVVELGYLFPKYILELGFPTATPDSEPLHRSVPITGFKSWIGDYGMHALAIMTDDEHSSWAGLERYGYGESSITTAEGRVRTIKACFDGFRLIGLGIMDQRRSPKH